jgi:hypothetical protein
MSDAAILARLDTLEAESAIRRVVARYFQICDHLGPDTPFDELGNLFTLNACWQGQGRYQDAFGGYEGRDAIVAMIRSYCVPQPHFAMTAHFLSSESIAVTGDRACGEWMMLQTSTYTAGNADLRSAALKLGFARQDGQWRIADFRTANIFARRVDHWSDAANIPVPERVSSGDNK